jgi:UDP-2,3-diacylglucosamine pyrophosphatase LpxH
MKAFLRKLVLRASERFSSRPSRPRIFDALDRLFLDIEKKPGKRGILIPFELKQGKFILFSDQHKGAGNGADDFVAAEPNYLAALHYYDTHGYTLVNLGDNEELWENNLGAVKKRHAASFEAERKFIERNAFVKVVGNHDLFWTNDPFAWWQIKDVFKDNIKVYEGVILATLIADRPFYIRCTHGHQGDLNSDGNWFSKFFVSRIWAPLQSWLRINPNTPAYDTERKTLHNELMYEWSATRQDGILITGHTHQPVFASLTHLERLYKQWQIAELAADPVNSARLKAEIQKREKEYKTVSVDYASMLPTYFNTGCCCYDDGDITGIEIAEGMIRLVKWTSIPAGPQRWLLEERTLGIT